MKSRGLAPIICIRPSLTKFGALTNDRLLCGGNEIVQVCHLHQVILSSGEIGATENGAYGRRRRRRGRKLCPNR